MPETYNISELKKALEEMTGKSVHLYEKEELETESEINRVVLDDLMRKSFELTLRQLAVKNLFKQNLRTYIKRYVGMSDGKKLDDLILKNKGTIDNYYNHLTIEKDLLNEK